MARLNLIETMEPEPGQYLAIEERPQWFRNWEKTGLLAFEDKNDDGRIRYSASTADNELVTVDKRHHGVG